MVTQNMLRTHTEKTKCSQSNQNIWNHRYCSLREHLFLKIPSYKSTMDEKAKEIGIFVSTVWLWLNHVGWQSVWSLLVGQGKAIRHEIMVYKVLCSQCCQMALFGAKLEFFLAPILKNLQQGVLKFWPHLLWIRSDPNLGDP